MSCRVWRSLEWVKECICPRQCRCSSSTSHTPLHQRDWEAFLFHRGVQLAGLLGSPASMGMPATSQMRDTTQKQCFSESCYHKMPLGTTGGSPETSGYYSFLRSYPCLSGYGELNCWGQLLKLCLVEAELKKNLIADAWGRQMTLKSE